MDWRDWGWGREGAYQDPEDVSVFTERLGTRRTSVSLGGLGGLDAITLVNGRRERRQHIRERIDARVGAHRVLHFKKLVLYLVIRFCVRGRVDGEDVQDGRVEV